MSVAVPVIANMDVTARRLYLLQGVEVYHPVEDIYMEIRNLRKTDESKRVVSMPVSAFGNISKGSGKYTPRYARFNNGWKVIPFDEPSSGLPSGGIYVSGEQITDDGQSGPACMDMSGLVNSVILHYEPPAAEIVRDVESLSAIQQMSFDKEVWHDHVNGFTFAEFTGDPGLLGNGQYPASDGAEARQIAATKLLSRARFSGTHVMNAADDWSGFVIHGDSAVTSSLTVEATPDVTNCTIFDMTLSGVLDGGIVVRESVIDGISFFNGIIHNCAFTANPTVLGGASPANIYDCKSAVPGGNARPQIDHNGQQTPLAVRNWVGGLEIVNKTDPIGESSIDLSSGILYIRSSCTAGEITVRGVGMLVDESGPGCTVISDGLLDPRDVRDILSHVGNTAEISEDGLTVTIYARDNVTPLFTFAVSADGKRRELQ